MPHRKKRSSASSSSRRGVAHGTDFAYLLHQLLGHKSRRWKRSFALGMLLAVAAYIFFFYYFFVSSTGFRWRALYGDSQYPKGYEVHGIDVSRYQGNIDWEELSSRGNIMGYPVRFAFIKGTEGATKLDPKFELNFYQARQYGFIRGVYHFWSIHSSPRAQAYHFLDKVYLERGDLPPVLDVEHKPKGQSVQDFQTDVLTWLHIVEDRYGVKPIIYTYYKFKEQYLSSPVFDDYPYWIAHYYVDKMKFKGKWMFWQHTDAGNMPGISGHVDLNVFNGTRYDLERITIGSRPKVTVVQ